MMRLSFLALSIVLLISNSSAAQNVLTNGAFNADTAGWETSGDPTISVAWSTLDANGSSSSGSALVTNTYPTSSFSGPTQCLSVAPGSSILVGAKIRVPSGQARSGFALVWVESFAAADCTGGWMGTDTAHVEATDKWTAVGNSFQISATTHSVAIMLAVAKTADGGQFQAYFDDVFTQAPLLATLTVPSAASIHGQRGTFFHSDLWLLNRSFTNTQTITARFRCFVGQTCGSDSRTITLAPRQSKLYTDVLGSGLFATSETAGAIELTYDTSLGQISAGTRVYTPDLPAPTYGASIPALPSSEARTRAVFVGLGSNGGELSSGFRSNAGVYNPGSASASVNFTLHDGATGAVLGSPVVQTWGANEARQVNDVFAAAGSGAVVTTNAYLVVTSTTPVFAFVTVIDNQSGDSVFVPPSADEAP